MAGFFQALNDAARGAACSIIGGTAFIDGFMRDVGVPGTGAYEDRTRALRRQLCDNDDDVVPLPGTGPVTGGNCDGILYVTANMTYTDAACTTRDFNGYQIYGPVSANVLEDSGNRTLVIDGFNQNGTPNRRVVSGSTPSSPCPAAWLGGQFNRVDGGAECPAPEVPIPPYAPSPITVTINYENNQQITVNEDVDITIFSPQISLIGGIFAPITIAGNTFNLVGTVELTPEFKLNVSPVINISLGNGNTDNPIPNPDGDLPEPTVDPEERRVIIGAIATATSVSDRVDFLPQGGNPDVGIPNLGLVSFYVSTPNGTAWTADIPVKNVRTYIPCPVTSGAVDVAGTARTGILLDVQPIWGYPGQNLPS